jgi:hypothetical protein
LTTLPYRIPQGVTAPRCLRPTAVSIVETSPLSSAFTYGYRLRSVRFHRLRKATHLNIITNQGLSIHSKKSEIIWNMQKKVVLLYT